MSKMCPCIDYCYNRFGRQYTPNVIILVIM